MSDGDFGKSAVSKVGNFLHAAFAEAFSPTSLIPLLSLKAPAKISDAEAEPWFIRTTTGNSLNIPSIEVLSWVVSPDRNFSETTKEFF